MSTEFQEILPVPKSKSIRDTLPVITISKKSNHLFFSDKVLEKLQVKKDDYLGFYFETKARDNIYVYKAKEPRFKLKCRKDSADRRTTKYYINNKELVEEIFRKIETNKPVFYAKLSEKSTLGLAVRAGIPCHFSRNRSPDLVEDEVKFFW